MRETWCVVCVLRDPGESGRGQPHSKTLRGFRAPRVSPTGFGVRLPSAALVRAALAEGFNRTPHKRATAPDNDLIAVIGAEGDGDAKGAGEVHFDQNFQGASFFVGTFDGSAVIKNGLIQGRVDRPCCGERGLELVLDAFGQRRVDVLESVVET